MKKVFILIITIMIITSFSACKYNGKENKMVTYETGIYHDKSWNETVGTYSNPVVPDKETALKIAETVFNGMTKNNETQEYVAQSIFYDEQDEIWIISFWKDSDQNILGGECNIAIQKKDGKILRIWFGE